ncbi:MarR family transcriptional regulator [Paenibacillus sp. P26]|nr:MarR family transcriptional regulator [Paenibacillus sp. P26]UUZ93735.1 MarR family transcriptional regulator [Paenibacillus sp. P25]
MRLTESDGQIQKELARKVHVKPATMNVMITRMERAGLVVRRPDENDQRLSRVYLTDKGRSATGAVNNVLRDIEERALAHFSLEEKLLFRRLLQQMHQDLEDLKREK